MRKLKVLIASAGSVFGDVRKAALEHWGFDVTVATDGKQACATLVSTQVDLCILDWELPKMSGLAACKWTRSVDLKTQPYIVLMTDKNLPEQVQAAYMAGANDYLANPFNLEDLHFLVSTFAQKVSQKDVVSRELTNIDPLELYRRDLTAPKASSQA
ncbi:MAG TPA: response regulator [Candidatus Angelobacter sp.]|jgi:DNA-binding response OmpR family regulator